MPPYRALTTRGQNNVRHSAIRPSAAADCARKTVPRTSAIVHRLFPLSSTAATASGRKQPSFFPCSRVRCCALFRTLRTLRTLRARRCDCHSACTSAPHSHSASQVRPYYILVYKASDQWRYFFLKKLASVLCPIEPPFLAGAGFGFESDPVRDTGLLAGLAAGAAGLPAGLGFGAASVSVSEPEHDSSVQ